MKKYENKNKLIHSLREEIKQYSSLTVVDKNSLGIEITGSIIIKVLTYTDEFFITIKLDNRYPESFPELYETANRIPKKMWRHMYKNGMCCVCTKTEQRRFFPKGSPISVYIDKLVIPFFENQLHYEITGKYVKERKHGIEGILDTYSDIFKTKELKHIVNFMLALKSGNLKGHHLCECESGKKRRNCHGPLLWEAGQYISKEQAKMDLKTLTEVVKKQNKLSDNA